MKFIGKDGQEVELIILGYQFPNDFDNEWDANWLRIYLKVKSNFGNWQTVDSSVTTWEIYKLIQWFHDLSINKRTADPDMTFVEPNLAFELIDKTDESKTIQLRFDLESKPQSADDNKEYFINFQFLNQDLVIISKELSVQYGKFPIRPYPKLQQ